MLKSNKIAFLKSSILNRGGLEKYTRKIAARCAQDGHQVFLLTTDCAEELEPGVQTVNLGKRLPLSLAHLLWFDLQCKRYLEKHTIDIVFGMDRNFCKQTHYRAGNGVHAAYLERRKKRVGAFKRATFALNPLHQLILHMEKRTFESPHLQKLFTNSFLVAKEVQQHYPKVDPKKIVTIHNGVEWQSIEKPFLEGLEGRKLASFQFLFIGHEYERKGLTLLLKALSLLSSHDFELSVVGKERNIGRFELLTKELGLQERVRFCGAVSDTKPFYSAADCVVIPSLYDPFANVTVEALAFGVPVISSSSNGGSEVLTSERMGWVFDELEDPEELRVCLEKALERPKTSQSAKELRLLAAPFDFSQKIDILLSHLIPN